MDAISLLPLLFIPCLYWLTCHLLDRLAPVIHDEFEEFDGIFATESDLQTMPVWSYPEQALPAVA
jgi:hypothetical protein